VRVGGHGPAVVMLHGFGTTGDMRGHLASALIEDHMIIAPDLRGLGLSRRSLRAAMTRRIRRRTWWAFWTPWACIRPNW
jgi:pimeloyl-ACP methyl ester carboxylesterase